MEKNKAYYYAAKRLMDYHCCFDVDRNNRINFDELLNKVKPLRRYIEKLDDAYEIVDHRKKDIDTLIFSCIQTIIKDGGL